jgi:hypothetical protein
LNLTLFELKDRVRRLERFEEILSKLKKIEGCTGIQNFFGESICCYQNGNFLCTMDPDTLLTLFDIDTIRNRATEQIEIITSKINYFIRGDDLTSESVD